MADSERSETGNWILTLSGVAGVVLLYLIYRCLCGSQAAGASGTGGGTAGGDIIAGLTGSAEQFVTGLAGKMAPTSTPTGGGTPSAPPAAPHLPAPTSPALPGHTLCPPGTHLTTEGNTPYLVCANG